MNTTTINPLYIPHIIKFNPDPCHAPDNVNVNTAIKAILALLLYVVFCTNGR